jgi:hypothetical protein
MEIFNDTKRINNYLKNNFGKIKSITLDFNDLLIEFEDGSYFNMSADCADIILKIKER